MNLKWIVSSLAAIVIVAGGFAYYVNTKLASLPSNFGAVPSIQSPLCVNGVCEYFYSQSFRLASSTLCDILTPNATSTLVQATAFIAHPATYSQTYELGYSSTQDATTSALVASWTTTSTSTVNATTTATAPVDDLLQPNTHVVFNLSTSTATGANQATGTCSVRLITVNGNGTSFSN